MAMPTSRWVENVAGLGASGVRALVAWRWAGTPAPSGHPMVPMLTLAIEDEDVTQQDSNTDEGIEPLADVMLPPGAGAAAWSERVLERLRALASGDYTPLVFRHGNCDFQIPRGGAVSL